jgi:hypothetical protein
MSEKKRVTVNEIDGNLEKAFDELDQSRAAGLGELAVVHEARLNVQARDLQRLGKKLGPAHPRVAAAARALALGEDTVHELRLESVAASVKTPPVDDKSWVLHGRVFGEKRQPQKGLTIALYQGDKFLDQLGVAASDSNGYFLLQATGPEAIAGLSIHVLREGRVIHIDPDPVAIELGRAEYREITLGDDQVIPTPPATNPAFRTN